MSLLSPKSYHCLTWNFESAKAVRNLKMTLSALETFNSPQKLMTRKTSLFSYDQKEAEEKYRKLDSIDFRFNPKNYSVDCEQSALVIHRKLLGITGNDVVEVNNPSYFEEVRARCQAKENNNVIISEKLREKKEIVRVQTENFKLKKLNKSISYNNPIKRINLKFDKDHPGASSKDCFSFTYDESSCCISEISSDDSLDPSKFRKRIDSLDDVKEIGSMYVKARDYINKILLTPHPVKPRIISTTPEFVSVFKPQVLPASKLENKEERMSKKEKIISIDSEISRTTKPASCGCGKKKK